MKYVAVGDIHGTYGQLDALLREEDLFTGRQAVFLGDYVDVGPCSRDVLERLVCFKGERPDSIFLLGNHEYEMLRYYDGGEFLGYAKRGGLHTIKAYVGEVCGDVHGAFVSAVPNAHIEFLRSLSVFVETHEYLFSHCGYDVERPFDRSLDAMVLGSHQALFESSPGLSKVAVCGHYFQSRRVPFMSRSVICLDSGCGVLGGPLSACLLPEREVVEIFPDLSVRAPR